jgi:Leucine-rich repeat (LRR) protein
LNLFNNRLSSLPESVGYLSELSYLQLSANRLGTLPAGLQNNKKLKCLGIFTNELTGIPTELAHLQQLEELNIGDNNISRVEHIPASIRKLSIYANPLLYIDPAIIERFRTVLKDESFTLLYVDKHQASSLGLNERAFKALQIVDLASGKIDPWQYKNMPPELLRKWGLERAAFKQ